MFKLIIFAALLSSASSACITCNEACGGDKTSEQGGITKNECVCLSEKGTKQKKMLTGGRDCFSANTGEGMTTTTSMNDENDENKPNGCPKLVFCAANAEYDSASNKGKEGCGAESTGTAEDARNLFKSEACMKNMDQYCGCDFTPEKKDGIATVCAQAAHFCQGQGQGQGAHGLEGKPEGTDKGVQDCDECGDTQDCTCKDGARRLRSSTQRRKLMFADDTKGEVCYCVDKKE